MDRYPLSHVQMNTTNTYSNETFTASLVTISLPIGSLIVGPLIDRFGRKPIAIVTTIPFLISWILIATSKNVETIYAARILAGIGAGIYFILSMLCNKSIFIINCRTNNSCFNLCQ